MKKILLLALFAAGGSLFAQNTAALCENAYSLCGALGEPFANTTDAPSASAESAENYGCLITYPNPAWFYLPISQAGDLTFTMTQTSDAGFGIDVDYICWGPFNTMDGVCGPENLNPLTQVGCSYSTASVEQFTLQNATVGSYYVILITNFSNMPGTIKVENTGGTGVNPGGALNCSGINLNAFLDANANGTQDTGEMGFPYGNFIYNTNPDGNEHNVTSFNGDYTIYDENLTNTYNISYELPAQYSGYYSVTTSSYNNVAVESANNVVTYNFPVVQNNIYQDLSVNVVASWPVPGFTYMYYVTYTNAGPQAVASGSVNFNITPGYNIVDVTQAGTPVTVNYTATGFDYTFANLQPFESVTLAITVQVPVIPDVALGDEVTAVVAITPLDGDAMPDDNTSTNVQVVVGSYDPNDIMESRGREIEINTFDDADYLYYTIRFQNTGTYEARNAKIEDLLGTQFDYNSVQVLRSSHNFTMDRQNNHLSWTFNNIHLPAAQDNEEGSHGYVYFKVKPLPGYEVGDIIPNSADIYFDFNPAIVTNTFESEFVDAAMGTINIIINGFTMYPNPSKGLVNIMAAGNDTLGAIRIYDVTGKTIYTNKLNGVSAVVNSSAFASGTYFVEVLSGNNAKTVKKLLIE
jgi:uncharacterized repeat protein (TIGR01451 family)